MAKKRRRTTLEVPSFKPPSPAERPGYASDEFSRAAVHANPGLQKLKASIRARALKAAKAKS
jgi:hypothetical protein